MKILYFANTDWYLFNFRLSLMSQVREFGHEVVLVSPSGKYIQKLQEQGFNCQILEMDRRSLNPFREMLVLLSLVKIYRKENPDVVHHFTLKCVLYGMLAALLTRVNVKINAITGMGYIFTAESLKAKLLKPIVRLVMQILLKAKGSKVIVQNSDDYNLLTDHNLVELQSLVLIRGSGVNTDKFSPKNRKTKNNAVLTVLMATRLLEDKGVREYIQAALEIKKERKNVQFLLAGEPDYGNPSSLTAAEIQQWEALADIRLLGHVENIERVLDSVDVVVLPSYREGLPRILIEAASCEIPIVTTDVPGCREVVVHGENGFLVPAKNVDKLSLFVLLLLDSTRLRKKMGKAGRQRVEKYLDERIVIGETIKTYQLD